MRTPIRLLLGALALVAPAWLIVAADSGPTPPERGRVLLLQNERTLEGDIEKVGDQYRVRRTVGETWVPADKVACLCRSYEEAYAFLRDRANLRDPDERLRLARWCYLHDLREQALAEVAAAARLRPDHEATQRLLAGLQRSAALGGRGGAQRHSDTSGRGFPALNPSHPEPPEPLPLPPVDVTQEVLGQFVSRVQPILLNACASCHASGRGGSFKLVRPLDSEVVGPKTLQQNLASVLAQVNLEQPQASPLLSRAVSIHGEMKEPPLRGRQMAAYRALEEWVRLTAANNPHLRPSAGPAATDPAQPSRPPAAEGTAPPPPQPPPPPAERGPEQPTTPADPFDPALFNRQAGPGR
ncbi:MAG TPA: hypothetical protein VNK04_14350 [Gemmataceae bacterium]|nr:hypothetical protein [Gemmataceae bacterium]